MQTTAKEDGRWTNCLDPPGIRSNLASVPPKKPTVRSTQLSVFPWSHKFRYPDKQLYARKKSRDVLGLFDLLVAFQRFEINHFVRLLTRQKIEKCNFEKSSSIVNVYLNSYLRVKTVCVRQVHHLLSSHSRRSVRNNSLIQKIASQLRRQKFKQLQGDCQKDSRLGKVNKT